MIKKTTGIATILLLILVIAIGIAKANTLTARSLNADLRGLNLHTVADVDRSLHLSDLRSLAALDVEGVRLLPADGGDAALTHLGVLSDLHPADVRSLRLQTELEHGLLLLDA